MSEEKRGKIDTEAIASEIVSIRGRLEEMDREMEGASTADDERRQLEERLRFLQGELSSKGDHAPHDDPGADAVHYVPPA